jgi:hypothetical protein
MKEQKRIVKGKSVFKEIPKLFLVPEQRFSQHPEHSMLAVIGWSSLKQYEITPEVEKRITNKILRKFGFDKMEKPYLAIVMKKVFEIMRSLKWMK